MSARFRRRGEIVEAVQFDGTNAEECAQLVEYRLEEFRSHWRVGDWAVSVGLTSCRDHYDDRQFRSYFEPVPLPEPAPADGWVRVEDGLPEVGTRCLVFTPGGKYGEVWIDEWKEQHEAPVSFSSATIPIGPGWDEHEFEEVAAWRPLPAPPVVEGGK